MILKGGRTPFEIVPYMYEEISRCWLKMLFNFSETKFSNLCMCLLFECLLCVVHSKNIWNTVSACTNALLFFLQDKVYSSVLQQCYSMYKVELIIQRLYFWAEKEILMVLFGCASSSLLWDACLIAVGCSNNS